MDTNHELRILNRRASELIAEWVRVKAGRHPTTAVERVEIARRARRLLEWVETDEQALMDELSRGSDKDVLKALNTLHELSEKLRHIINEVY
jgi:hypothetical protein